MGNFNSYDLFLDHLRRFDQKDLFNMLLYILAFTLHRQYSYIVILGMFILVFYFKCQQLCKKYFHINLQNLINSDFIERRCTEESLQAHIVSN